MSLEACQTCGENTMDTDYDTEFGIYIGYNWHCDTCKTEAVRIQLKGKEILVERVIELEDRIKNRDFVINWCFHHLDHYMQRSFEYAGVKRAYEETIKREESD
jgi:hypothetical protein